MAKPLGLPLTSTEAEAKFAWGQKKKNIQTRLTFVSNLLVKTVQEIGGQTSDFYFKLLDSVCNLIEQKSISYYNNPDTLFVINDKSHNTILSFIMEPAGINQFENEKFKIYPNPFSNTLKIENNEWTYFEFDIINIVGKVLYKSGAINKTSEPNLSFLDKGLYLLRLTDPDKRIYVRKILKN